MDERKTCVVTGVGPGTGSALVRRFAAGGYKVAMIARTAERLEAITSDVPNSTAYPCDVTDVEALNATLKLIKDQMGPPDVAIHNAVGGAFGDFLTLEPSVLERNFQINTMALLHLARALVPDMAAAGHGAIICTGNTSAYRGKSDFAMFAPSKAAQRVLAEAIARSVGPKGVHVAYVAVDAVIDVPRMRERLPGKPDDFFCQPDDIAEECFRIAHQPRSAWTFDVMIRPYGENW